MKPKEKKFLGSCDMPIAKNTVEIDNRRNWNIGISFFAEEKKDMCSK